MNTTASSRAQTVQEASAAPAQNSRARTQLETTRERAQPRVNRKLPPELAEARKQGLHNIGDAAERSGVSAKMIRRYERIGLVPAAGRTYAGYRIYSESDVHRFRVIKRARSLGFSLKQIQTLLELWGDRSRTCATMKQLVRIHTKELSARIREMRAMQRALRGLISDCPGSDCPQCPILENLITAPGASIADALGQP